MEKKIIVLADIHIDDYRSDIPGSRLSNYLKLAEIVRDKTKELKSDWIFIAGDIFNRPVSPPHVVNVVRQFFDILLESGARIAFITGQHDQNVKELESLKDTYLGVFCDNKVLYADRKSLTIEGTKIYFENYTRSQVVDPEKECDVFISHVTLGMQKVNNSKFKLGVFGDIHAEVDIDNMHSVCPPICIHAHEKPEGVIGILTVGIPEPKFERFEYDPEFKIFPKLEREYREVKSKADLSEADREVIDILRCDHDFYSEVNDIVNKLDLSEIHRDVDLSHAPEPISLDFKIKEVYARNFRSIEDACFSIDQLGKVIFISGKNGSGKTSIIEAMFVALLGDRNLEKKYQSKWSSSEGVMVGVKLTYKGSDYEICRGSGWTKFIVNGEEVTKANKTALEGYIYETLPFLNLVWMFYIKTYEHFFDKDRISLVKKCFNLDVFDHFYNQGKLILSNTKSRLSKALEKNSLLKGRHEQEKVQLNSIIENLKKYDTVDVSELDSIMSKLNELRETLTKRALTKGKVETLKSQKEALRTSAKELPSRQVLEQYKKDLEEADKLSLKIRLAKRNIQNLESTLNALKIVTCPKCGEQIQVGGEAKANLESRLAETKVELESCQELFKRIFDKNIPYTLSEVQDLIVEAGKLESTKVQLDKISFDLETEYANLRELDSLLEDLPQERDLQNKVVMIEKKKMLLQSKLESESNIQNIIADAKICKQERTELQLKLEKCEKYIMLFDMKNLDSLPYKLLVKISEFLSTDKIRFRTYSQQANGNLILDISCELKVGDEFINYDTCSHGQKAVMDFFILSRFLELLNITGIVAIDEGLSVLDPDWYDGTCETIRDLNTYNVFITSHQLGFAYYDSLITCTLQDNGRTTVEVS